MEIVYKYELLPAGGYQVLELPEGAEPLCAAMQNGIAMLWARVNPANPKMPMHVAIVGTGHPLPEVIVDGITGDWVYLSTMHNVENWMVFHVFWRSPTGLGDDK